ncbi:MAG: DUF429 domain-containing protein [Dehalococcoidia bacterium]|nr:MAG: DUF429 domain-containing protein [Dehalococcoidia bacterium]
MSSVKPAPRSRPSSRPRTVLGLDLRSAPRYPTGLAVMGQDGRLVDLRIVRTDEAILEAVRTHRPSVIAIDAPLALPEGRDCADPTCSCASAGIMREVDRAAARAGYRPFPTLLPSMVRLTLRGIALRETLQAAGHRVLEVYPGMTQDVLGIPRKGAGLKALRRGLFRAGIRGFPQRAITHDELDAVTCALTGVLHLERRTEVMGPGIPVPLVLPRRTRTWVNPVVGGGPSTAPTIRG